MPLPPLAYRVVQYLVPPVEPCDEPFLLEARVGAAGAPFKKVVGALLLPLVALLLRRVLARGVLGYPAVVHPVARRALRLVGCALGPLFTLPLLGLAALFAAPLPFWVSLSALLAAAVGVPVAGVVLPLGRAGPPRV